MKVFRAGSLMLFLCVASAQAQFNPAYDVEIHSLPNIIAAGHLVDIDPNDGIDYMDLVVTHGGFAGISILTGHGDGTFDSTRFVYDSTGANKWSDFGGMYISDLDGDSLNDIVSAGGSQYNIKILLNRSTTVFPVFETLSYNLPDTVYPGGDFVDLCGCDFDDDGDADLAVATHVHDVHIFENITSVTDTVPVYSYVGKLFKWGLTYTNDGVINCAELDSMSAGPDIVVIADGGYPNGSLGNIVVFKNNGSAPFGAGTFDTAAYYGTSEDNLGTQCLVLQDFDGDSHPDLAMTYSQIDSIAVMQNVAGAFTNLTYYPVSQDAIGIAAGQFDQTDNNIDLVISTDDSLLILRGNGDMTFEDPLSYPVNADADDGITTGDFVRDCDSFVDIAVVDGEGGSHSFAVLLDDADPQCNAIPGDANATETLTTADVIAISNYIYNKPGWPSCPSMNKDCWLSDQVCRGDVNGTVTITNADLIYLANWIYNKPRGDCTPSYAGECWRPVPSCECCQLLP
ncbi:MAG: hypothetical protein L0Y74_02065 [candidate division Zixibacteria bacterium]|nr:hypothetical protein [candidate division Zixibacteria bacterium]